MDAGDVWLTGRMVVMKDEWLGNLVFSRWPALSRFESEMKFFRKASEIMSVFPKFQYFCKALCIFAMAGSMALAHADGLPKFKKGEDYAKVRIKLLGAGWTPRRMPDADECMQGDKRCQGRPEMEACSGVEKANCRFAWQRAGARLTIFTVDSPALFDSASNE